MELEPQFLLKKRGHLVTWDPPSPVRGRDCALREGPHFMRLTAVPATLKEPRGEDGSPGAPFPECLAVRQRL